MSVVDILFSVPMCHGVDKVPVSYICSIFQLYGPVVGVEENVG